MHVLVNARIELKDEFLIDEVSEFLEGIGEVFYDDDENSLNLSIDESWIDDPKIALIDGVFKPLYRMVGEKAKFEGTIQDDDNDRIKNFKGKYSDGAIRYKETDFYYNGDLDNMTYEELEESGNGDFSEDDFDEYSHRTKIEKDMLFQEYNDWECYEVD